VRSLIRAATGPTNIVMDSFAGTGTTAHAVLAVNKADGGNRRFILVEMEPDICQKVTAQRLTRAIQGYESRSSASDSEPTPAPGPTPSLAPSPNPSLRGRGVEGLGGGFRFCKLSHSIFDENGQINAEVRFADLAAHVFFTETGEPIPKRPRRHPHPSSPVKGEGFSPLIGVCNGTAYYLLFNGVLGDKRPDGGNVLTSRILDELPAHDGPKVVYGEGCRLGAARLKREGITFKQVPYEIKTG